MIPRWIDLRRDDELERGTRWTLGFRGHSMGRTEGSLREALRDVFVNVNRRGWLARLLPGKEEQ